jgi:hypothetical protein
MNKKFYLPFIIAISVVLSFFAVYGRQQKSSSPMQTWEYKAIIIGRSATNLADFSTWAEATGATVKELPLPVSMPTKAQELGAQGWELVSVAPVSSHVANGTAGFTDQIIYWFKRTK